MQTRRMIVDNIAPQFLITFPLLFANTPTEIRAIGVSKMVIFAFAHGLIAFANKRPDQFTWIVLVRGQSFTLLVSCPENVVNGICIAGPFITPAFPRHIERLK